MSAPGTCADCGGEAYIQLAGEGEMLCAHCFDARRRTAARRAARPAEQRERQPAER